MSTTDTEMAAQLDRMEAHIVRLCDEGRISEDDAALELARIDGSRRMIGADKGRL